MSKSVPHSCVTALEYDRRHATDLTSLVGCCKAGGETCHNPVTKVNNVLSEQYLTVQIYDWVGMTYSLAHPCNARGVGIAYQGVWKLDIFSQLFHDVPMPLEINS